MQQRFSSSIGRLLALAGLGAATLIGGCGFKPGGSGSSRDSFCYTSTPHLPQTVSLIDTTRGQTIWTCEVPVGQQLVVHFINEGGDSVARGTDTMRWDLMPIGSPNTSLSRTFVCPPSTARRLDGTVRPGPEPYPVQYESFTNAASAPGAYTPAAVSAGEDVTPRVPGTIITPSNAPASNAASPSDAAPAANEAPADGRFDPSKPFPRPSEKAGTKARPATPAKPATPARPATPSPSLSGTPTPKPAAEPAPIPTPAGDPPVDLPD